MGWRSSKGELFSYYRTDEFWATMNNDSFYIAQDKNGIWYQYKFKPKLESFSWVRDEREQKSHALLEYLYLSSNWRKSLIVRPNMHLIVWFKDLGFTVMSKLEHQMWDEEGAKRYGNTPFILNAGQKRYFYSNWITFFFYDITAIQISDFEKERLLKMKKTGVTEFVNFENFEV